MAAKISTWSDGCTVLGGGVATIDITIPGTFASIDPASASFVGRQLLKAGIWFEGRAAGDRVKSMTVEDSDGVIPVPARAAFPNYPILASLHESAIPSGNQGITLPPGGLPFTLDFPNTNKAKIASGLHIIAVLQKAIPAIDVAYFNLAWDDLT